MTEIERKIGYSFKNKGLIASALCHSSYANENKNPTHGSNERLEFLGDSVLGMLVAQRLFSDFPELPEGRMTRLRSELVCENNLVKIAKELNLGGSLLLGRGEDASGGRSRPSILADAVEALLAAVYLDGGLDSAAEFVDRFVLENLSEDLARGSRDYKTALQETVQQKTGQTLSYHLLSESGPDHDKVFKAEVRLNDAPLGKGEGRTKKEAEQLAAKHALEELEK